MLEFFDDSSFEYISPIFNNLLALCTEDDVGEVVTLFNQLVSRLKVKFFNTANELFMVFVTKILGFVETKNPNRHEAVISDELRQALTLQKLLFTMLTNLVQSDLITVFTSSRKKKRANYNYNNNTNKPRERAPSNLPIPSHAPVNASHLNKILQVVLEGCGNTNDFSISKICFLIMGKFVEKWAGTAEGALPGFNQFVYEHILKACFTVPMSPDFDLKDAAAVAALNEICNLQKTILLKCGIEYMAFLNEKLFPALQLQTHSFASFAQNLQSSNPQDFRKYFKQLVESRKT